MDDNTDTSQRAAQLQEIAEMQDDLLAFTQFFDPELDATDDDHQQRQRLNAFRATPFYMQIPLAVREAWDVIDTEEGTSPWSLWQQMTAMYPAVAEVGNVALHMQWRNRWNLLKERYPDVFFGDGLPLLSPESPLYFGGPRATPVC